MSFDRWISFHSLSMSPAAPIPDPTHIETTPFFPFVLFSSGIRVAICLAPNSQQPYPCKPKDVPAQLLHLWDWASCGRCLAFQRNRLLGWQKPSLFPKCRCLALSFLDIELTTCFFEQLGNNYSWADSHDFRRTSFSGIPLKSSQNGQFELLGGFPPREKHCCCPIWDLRTVAWSGAAGFAEWGFEFGKHLQSGLSNSIVLGDCNLLLGALVVFDLCADRRYLGCISRWLQ